MNNTTQFKQVTVKADPDADDCLDAAEASYKWANRELEGWDLHPEWADELNRDLILLTVPVL